MRKLGLEFEFPMVNEHGNSASYADNLRLWHAWKKYGYKYKRDSYTKKIVGVSKKCGRGVLDVGTDYCVGTLEIAMPPAANIHAAEKEWNTFLYGECLPILKKHKLRILGYSTQPKSKHLKKTMAPKGHYAILNQFLDPSSIEWIRDKGSGFTAAQYNFDVSLREAIDVANCVIKLTPLIWAWSMNDPVSNGEITPYLSTRLRVHDLMINGKRFKDRLCFPEKEYSSVEDYIDRAWSKPVFEIIRDGKNLYPAAKSLTTWDFIKRKKALFFDLHGYKHTVEIVPNDLSLGVYFYWPTARIKISFDESNSVDEIAEAVRSGHVENVLTLRGRTSFVEIRPVSMSPQAELFAWPTLFLGIIENISKAKRLTATWDTGTLASLLPLIQKKGFITSWKGKKMHEWARDVLEIARKGLMKKDKRLVSRIGCLENRIERKATPALDAIKVYREKGMEKYIEYLTIK